MLQDRNNRKIKGRLMTRAADSAVRAKITSEKFSRTMQVSNVNSADRTVDLAFSSEFPVERFFGIEVLSHEEGAANLARLNSGGALLLDHDPTKLIGTVISARIDADKIGRATVKFSRSVEAQDVFNDVVDEIRKNVSFGYSIDAYRVENADKSDETFIVTQWTALEISFVAIPADPTVGVGRSHSMQNGIEPISVLPDNGGVTGDPANPGVPDNSARGKVMKKKAVRAANGDLVFAEVDESGAVVNVLDIIESAEQVRQRVSSADASVRASVSSMVQLGAKYGQNELASRFISEGKTEAELQAAILDAVTGQGANIVPADGSRSAPSGTVPLSEMPSGLIGMSEADVRKYSIFRAVRSMLPNASTADIKAAEFERHCSEQAAKAFGKEVRGILIPEDVLASGAFGSRANPAFNAGGIPGAGDTGGNVIAETLLAGSFVSLLRNRTVFLRRCQMMGGLVGNVAIPRQVDGSQAFWIKEGDNAQQGAPTLDQIGLTPKTVGAYTDITRKLMQQSTPDAEWIVRNDLLNAMAQAIDVAGWYGTGATDGQPLGLKPRSGTGTGKISTFELAGSLPTYDEYVDMETTISTLNADVSGMAYIINSKGRGAAKTTPKFPTTAVAGAGVIWESGNQINGYAADVTNQIKDGDTFFGNFQDVIMGMWGGLDLQVDPYTQNLSGALRLIAFQDVDIAVRREQSFVVATAKSS